MGATEMERFIPRKYWACFVYVLRFLELMEHKTREVAATRS